MRVYIPATFGMLQTLLDEGELRAAHGWAFAVTPALQEFYAEGDEDELADIAFTDAARTSLRLLSEYSGQFELRRVVVSADIKDDAELELTPDMGEDVVKLGSAIPADAIAAVHVDVASTEELTRAAIEAVDAADLGDEDAELAVGDCLEVPLAWYDSSEIGMLVELL
ncbi:MULTISPECIES: DUF6912 family protein [unclassified Corynebacterium]|uniref:DUF6912 family protein n=1 Tax=unclassified Corynebacterium TaxID=2624378 RepID=UPI00309BC5D2